MQQSALHLRNQDLIDRATLHVATTYGRAPIALVRGEGTHVWDADGKMYYDFLAGLGVNNLGHCHPRVVEAIRQQAGLLLHVSNLYHIQPQIELAEMLAQRSFADRSFFCNSGTEACEAAIKLARKYSHDHFGEGRYEIITMEHSFHGRTMGSLSATAQTKYHKGFEPLLDGFAYAPFNDVPALARLITPKTCAIMLEPVQGEGGVHVPSLDYLKGVRELCDARHVLLIYDEVQCGIGRTGDLFAHEHEGVPPDIMTLAKSLAGGVPIGAMLAREQVATAFVPGTHAATFGGNPLATAAGVAALKAIQEEGMLENCQRVGAYFRHRLQELQGRHAFIKEVRGRGLMLGIELDIPGNPFVTACLERGFLINCTVDTVVRFLPPLIVREPEVDLLITTLDELFGKV
ncbi:MAG: acetylornithine transaminase [Nitrospinae bacterium]|nr:acetylornithine transaminase [Nitrospinota bacterium]